MWAAGIGSAGTTPYEPNEKTKTAQANAEETNSMNNATSCGFCRQTLRMTVDIATFEA
jgi:hypothetical protein